MVKNKKRKSMYFSNLIDSGITERDKAKPESYISTKTVLTTKNILLIFFSEKY